MLSVGRARWRSALPLAAALTAATAPAACGEDTCQALVRESCGEEGQCSQSSACAGAKQLARQGVTTACEEARDNSYGYPDCEL